MKKLHQMNNQVELADVEKFVAILEDIERLVPRLNCINFKLGFNELVENLKPNLEAGREACGEITASSKFREILSLILKIGNMMNSEKGKTTGFDLAILAELHTVKSSNTKRTLLHFIVETIQQKYPALLNFSNELPHVEAAARLNTSYIEETIQTITTSSENLQNELKFVDAFQNKSLEDKFVDVMAPFSLECHDQVEVFIKMKNSYAEVGDYFAFNVSKCPIQECLTVIKVLKDQFAKAFKDIMNESKANSQLIEKLAPTFAETGITMSIKRLKSECHFRYYTFRSSKHANNSEFFGNLLYFHHYFLLNL